jgi:gamma-glutamyltranspeptidase/glutathione hydrolase
VLGTQGGSTIITSVYQTIIDVLDFHMSAQEAVSATRFHHQLWPPELITYSISRPLPQEVIRALAARGYRAELHPWEIGDVQLLWRDRGNWTAASDPRGRGEARIIH